MIDPNRDATTLTRILACRAPHALRFDVTSQEAP